MRGGDTGCAHDAFGYPTLVGYVRPMTAAAPVSPPLIKASGLALSRGGRTLARGLSLAAGPGGALVLTGPNGSGKTTLLRALAGLARPEAGEISPDDRGEAIAFLGHAEGLKPSETVIATLQFWAKLHRAAPGSVEAALRAFAIAHLTERPCGHLSAGQRRRVALARVALSGRAVWLLDEPAAPLDSRGRALLAAAVARHRAGGGAVIAATHEALDWLDAEVISLASALESAA